MTDRTVHVMISGRVQGVGYRAWCHGRARAFGLGGWVRNRRSGEVEAVFSGPAETVETMLAACREGPGLAHVLAVTVLADSYPDVPASFEVRSTL